MIHTLPGLGMLKIVCQNLKINPLITLSCDCRLLLSAADDVPSVHTTIWSELVTGAQNLHQSPNLDTWHTAPTYTCLVKTSNIYPSFNISSFPLSHPLTFINNFATIYLLFGSARLLEHHLGYVGPLGVRHVAVSQLY